MEYAEGLGKPEAEKHNVIIKDYCFSLISL